MALKYGFFNSVNGDRLYNADDISTFFYKLISDGVLASPSTSLQVQESSGMQVSVAPGYGMINAKYINLTTPQVVQLAAADIALDRIDRIVMKLDKENRQITITAKTGTPSATPSAPSLTRTDDVWELSLARIAVAHGAISVTQANITDERSNTSVCGYITGMIDQIDTTGLFAQFTAAFNAWFNSIKDEVLRNTLVRRYTSSTASTAGDTDIFAIAIPEYNAALDVLNVYVNGFRLTPETDYDVLYNAQLGYYVKLTSALDVVGTPVDFEVLKSIDGSQAESVVQSVYELQQRMGGLTLRKLTKAAYDAIDVKDSNTLYIVLDGSSASAYIGSILISCGGGGAATPETFTMMSNGITGEIGTYTMPQDPPAFSQN